MQQNLASNDFKEGWAITLSTTNGCEYRQQEKDLFCKPLKKYKSH